MKTALKNPYKPKIRLRMGTGYRFVDQVVKTNNLQTVCEEARCPNIYECWDRRTATIMLLGDVSVTLTFFITLSKVFELIAKTS